MIEHVVVDVEIQEVWKAVLGWPRYEVSSFGRIRSLKGAVKILSQRKQKNGYITVNLYNKGVGGPQLVHKLVLEAFAGPRPEGLVCRHFPDPNKGNNRIGNLLWGTPEQNYEDRDIQGRTAKKETNGRSVLNQTDVAEIRKLRGVVSVRQLAARYGVSKGQISRIWNFIQWRD